MTGRTPLSGTSSTIRRLARPLKRTAWRLRVERDAHRARRGRPDLSIFHDFSPAPAGGANQTLRAIVSELERRGVRIELQTISPSSRAVLFNSFNFDFSRLRLFAQRHEAVRKVHRVGAVTSLYRGFDDGTDARVAAVNHEFADATIAISHATVAMYGQIGIELVAPRVIYNGCDDRIFHRRGRTPFTRDRRVRLITSSWSSNPNKGAAVYRWLDENLDWSRFEFTFVGNAPAAFEHIAVHPPVGSDELASLLRAHDVFVTGTANDAYSNALVEALSCGLPAIYLDSGGSREAVKEAGFGFTNPADIPTLLEQLVVEYDDRQAAISLPTLGQVTNSYLEVLGLDAFVAAAS